MGNCNMIGKKCELCGEGLITYIKIGGGLFRPSEEYTTCSNMECKGHVTMT
jgi:hypothetical protein